MLLLPIALAAGSVIAPCVGFEANLRVEKAVVQKGGAPTFKLAVKNTSDKPLRILDTRGGRRGDLNDNYYRLQVETERGTRPDLMTAISDPGPVSKADFAFIRSGETAEITVTTPFALEELPKGKYRAHVEVQMDPYRNESQCRSTSASFRVQ